MSEQLTNLRAKWAHVPGMTVRYNADKEFTVVRLHYTADPAKCDERWIKKAKAGYPSVADWRREMEIDRARGGRAYYPAFAEGGTRYIRKAQGFMRAVPMVRGWDFGGAHPACVWGQYSRRDRRLWYYRELLGVDIDTFAFRDLVKYLSGSLTLADLQRWPRAVEMLEEIGEDSRYPPPPWFDGAYRFVDFTGHEGVMGTRGLTTGGEKRTATEILAEGGIHLLSHYVHLTTRRQVLGGLAHVRADGYPGVLFDPACPILVEGVTSEIKFAKPTPDNPDPSEPQKDDYYGHVHDAAGYLCVNTVTIEEADWLPESHAGRGYVEPVWGDGSVETYLSEGR